MANMFGLSDDEMYSVALSIATICSKVLAPMRERFKQYEGLKEYVTKPLTSK